MRELNLAKARSTWKVTLPCSDSENGVRVIHIKSPSKNTLTELYELKDSIGSAENIQKLDPRSIGAMWDFAAVAMGNNVEKYEITADELEEELSLTDLFEFYAGYIEFVNEQTKGKN